MNPFDLLLLLVGLYASLVTVFLIREQAKGDDSHVDTMLEKIAASQDSEEIRFKYFLEIAKLRHSRVPWYMRSLSTIGVVAFISMVVATAVQTITLSFESLELERLEGVLEELSDQEVKHQLIVKSVTDVIFELYARSMRLPAKSHKILQLRLEQLQTERVEPGEQFRIAMLLQNYEVAIEVLAENEYLLDAANPIDRLSLAQYYFLLGDSANATELMRSVQADISMLPIYWQAQLTIIDYLLESKVGTEELHGKRLSRILRIPLDDAIVFLRREAKKLGEARFGK